MPAGASTAAAAAIPTLTPPLVPSATTVPTATATAVSRGAAAATPEPTSRAVSPTASPPKVTTSETTAIVGAIVMFTADSVTRYRINEQLARLSLPTEVVGETRDITGSIVLSADGDVERDASIITIGLASLGSDERRRDGYVRGRTLRTRQFPEATVEVSELRGPHRAGHRHHNPRCNIAAGVGGRHYL